MKTTAAVRRQIGQILSSKILGLHVNKSDRYDRSSLISQLSKDEKVVNALQALYSSTAEACPAEKNTYSKFPALGDIWYVAKHFDEVDEAKKAALQAFLAVVIDCETMKGQSFSHRINKTNWFSRFKVKSGPELKEPKPIYAGQTFYEQPIPSDTKIRHQREKAGDALIPSNLSKEQSKGELESSANPDAFMKNDALPIQPSIHDAMTDFANAEPTSDMKWKTTMQGHSTMTDMKLMKNRPTEKTSGYRAKGQYLPAVPKYASSSESRQSREEGMVAAANSQMDTGRGIVTPEGQQQLNVTTYQNFGQGTGGKTTMGAVPGTEYDGKYAPPTVVRRDSKVSEHATPAPGTPLDRSGATSPIEIEKPSAEEPDIWLGAVPGWGAVPEEKEGAPKLTRSARKRERLSAIGGDPTGVTMTSSSGDPPEIPMDLRITPLIFGATSKPAPSGGGDPSMLEVEGIADANLRMQKMLDDLDWDIESTIDAGDAKTFFKNFFKTYFHAGVGIARAFTDLFKSGQDIVDFRKELEAWVDLGMKEGDKAAMLAHKHIREGVVDYQEIKKVIDDMKRQGKSPSLSMFNNAGKGKIKLPSFGVGNINDMFKGSALEQSASTEPLTSSDVASVTKGGSSSSAQHGKKFHLQINQVPRRAVNDPYGMDPWNELPYSSDSDRGHEERIPVKAKPALEGRETRALHKAKPGTSEEQTWNRLDEQVQTAKKNNKLDELSSSVKNYHAQLKRIWGFQEGYRYENDVEIPAEFYNTHKTSSSSQSAEGSATPNSEGGATSQETAFIQTGGDRGGSSAGSGTGPASGSSSAPAASSGGAAVKRKEPEPEEEEKPSVAAQSEQARKELKATSEIKDFENGFLKLVTKNKKDDEDYDNLVSERERLKKKGSKRSKNEKARYKKLETELIPAVVKRQKLNQDSNDIKIKLLVLKYRQLQNSIKAEAKAFEGKKGKYDDNRKTYWSGLAASVKKFINDNIGPKSLPLIFEKWKSFDDLFDKTAVAKKDLSKYWTPEDTELLKSLPPDEEEAPPEEEEEEKKGPPPGSPMVSPPRKKPAPGSAPSPADAEMPPVGTPEKKSFEPPELDRMDLGDEGFDAKEGEPYGVPRTGEPAPFEMRPGGQPNPLIPVEANIPEDKRFSDVNGETQGPPDVNARGSKPGGELSINRSIENAYIPTLRLFMQEGDANIVTQINNNPTVQQLNRDVWYSFNAYDWETNNEDDNPLHLQNIVDEARRFHGPLDRDELMPDMASQATQESYNKYQKEVFQFPRNQLSDAASIMLDVRGGGPLMPQNEDETDASFHDVYMKPWIEIPESSPWKKFTQIAGTQVSDSYLRDSSTFKSNDNFAERYENAFIYSVDV